MSGDKQLAAIKNISATVDDLCALSARVSRDMQPLLRAAMQIRDTAAAGVGPAADGKTDYARVMAETTGRIVSGLKFVIESNNGCAMAYSIIGGMAAYAASLIEGGKYDVE